MPFSRMVIWLVAGLAGSRVLVIVDAVKVVQAGDAIVPKIDNPFAVFCRIQTPDWQDCSAFKRTGYRLVRDVARHSIGTAVAPTHPSNSGIGCVTGTWHSPHTSKKSANNAPSAFTITVTVAYPNDSARGALPNSGLASS